MLLFVPGQDQIDHPAVAADTVILQVCLQVGVIDLRRHLLDRPFELLPVTRGRVQVAADPIAEFGGHRLVPVHVDASQGVERAQGRAQQRGVGKIGVVAVKARQERQKTGLILAREAAGVGDFMQGGFRNAVFWDIDVDIGFDQQRHVKAGNAGVRPVVGQQHALRPQRAAGQQREVGRRRRIGTGSRLERFPYAQA